MSSGSDIANTLYVRNLGVADYVPVYTAMREYTEARHADSLDELWIVQHPPVYTQGVAGKAEHILNSKNIPVVPVNRGGQVTYHGPGQLVIYCLIDIERKKLAVKAMVQCIEQAMIELLELWSIQAIRMDNAPGVYIENAKIGSIGLRMHKGRSYHGLSLNVDMDLSPFSGINPCGFANMPVTQLADHGVTLNLQQVSRLLVKKLSETLHYQDIMHISD